MDLHAVILAGGRGERFWPLSRNRRPKQLLALLGEESLLESTLGRITPHVSPTRIWIVAGADLQSEVESLSLGVPPGQLIWEGVGRNTAAAIGAAAESVLVEGDADLLVLPSDHWISDAAALWQTIEMGRALLEQGHALVTFGIRPLYAETGYGYIERGEPTGPGSGSWRVACFHEKPGPEQAKTYLRNGNYYWNSGIFLFRAGTIAQLLRRHVAGMDQALDRLRKDLRDGIDPAGWLRYFEASPAISIDHGVMEKADSVAVVEARFGWSDLGTWTSIAEHLPENAAGNRTRGEVLAQDSNNCILVSDGDGLLAVVGVKDLVVVRVGDATLVCPKSRVQDVRAIVQEGKSDARLRRFF
jgi:mannose-1-phosphate guanylyltransferase/mannose-6-phosphate isomerase